MSDVVPYVDGKISGQVEKRDRFGNLVSALDFKDGIFQGTGTGYYENGNPKYKLTAFNGKADNQRLMFDESGTLLNLLLDFSESEGLEELQKMHIDEQEFEEILLCLNGSPSHVKQI